jgi:protein SCO1/2
MKTLVLFLLTSLPVIVLEATTHLEAGNKSKTKTAKVVESKVGQREDMCCVKTMNSSPLPGNSIYQLQSSWKDQNGKDADISNFKGKVEVVAMFYSHCTYACPLTINDMKRIESALPKNIQTKVGFILVTFDPKRDTPRVLKTLTLNQQLDERRWSLLSGREADIRSLAAVLGVEFKKKSNGDFLHSSQITVLNSEGEIAYKHLGLNNSIDEVVQAIVKCTEANRLQVLN